MLLCPLNNTVLRRTLVPTQHLIHKLQSAHADKGNSQGFLSPLTVSSAGIGLRNLSTQVEQGVGVLLETI